MLSFKREFQDHRCSASHISLLGIQPTVFGRAGHKNVLNDFDFSENRYTESRPLLKIVSEPHICTLCTAGPISVTFDTTDLYTVVVGICSFRPDIQRPRQMENAMRDI